MQNILRILHYIVFALLVVCNAIIASVAMWNQSVSPANASVYAIDICATCLAALGLVFSFTLLFLELAGQDSVTGKVWFECTWVSGLFVVNLAVASAASAILVTQSCIPNFVDACTSTQTLLSFSWLITFVLLIYGLTLFASIYLVRGEYPDIWSTHVNHIPRLSPKQKLSSRPPTPVFATFANIARAPSLVAPVPRPFRTFPMDDTVNTYQHHGFDPEYGTEHFEQEVLPTPRPIQRLPTLSDPTCRHSRFDPEYGTVRFEQEVPPAPCPIQRLPTLSDNTYYHSRFDPEYGIEQSKPEVHPVPRPIQRLPTLSDDTCQHHSGFDPKYRPERFEQEVQPTPRPVQKLSTLSDDSHRPAPSLYPQFIQCALQSDPGAQKQSFSAPERQGSLAQRMPSPLPLANWPRHDVLVQPVKSKRAKNSVDSNTALVSHHPIGPRGMPSSLEGGSAVGTEVV